MRLDPSVYVTYFQIHRLDTTNIEEQIVTGNTANCMVTLKEFSSRLQISIDNLECAQLFSLFEKVKVNQLLRTDFILYIFVSERKRQNRFPAISDLRSFSYKTRGFNR